EDGIRDGHVTGVQTCALPIWLEPNLDLNDLTTPILPASVKAEAPQLSGQLEPPPSRLRETYFITGSITKSGSGFFLNVQLKKSRSEERRVGKEGRWRRSTRAE